MRKFVRGLLMCGALFAQPRTKVILDTDIGDDIDDAWALGFAMTHKGFDLIGVTTAFGDVPARTPVALKLLDVCGKSSIPVAMGRSTRKTWAYQYAWAEDWSKTKPIAQDAAHFIVEQARKYPGEIVLMAVGPLPNVADALRLEPNLPKLLKRVVLMSGCIYGTAEKPEPIAEWNVVAEVKDAQVVYSAGLPLTIVPLDSTTKVKLSEPERDRVRKRESPLTKSLEALYRLWMRSPDSRMTLHDQLAVAETARPGELFGKLEPLKLVVDDKGFTRIDEAKGKPVTVCLEPKRDAFMDFYIKVLTGGF